MIGEITTTWTAVVNWLTDNIGAVQSIFYANDKLTFIGVLAITGVSVSVGLLIINKVKDFLHLA